MPYGQQNEQFNPAAVNLTGTAGCGYFTPRTLRRQGVAADGSRRTLSAAKTAPTAVGGYLSMKYPGQCGPACQVVGEPEGSNLPATRLGDPAP